VLDLLNYISEKNIHLLRERKKGLGLKTCYFKSQGVLIVPRAFQYPVSSGADTEKLVWENGFCPLFPAVLTSSIDIILGLLLGCSLLAYHECQDFSSDQVM
jgi:hypothetical protein